MAATGDDSVSAIVPMTNSQPMMTTCMARAR